MSMWHRRCATSYLLLLIRRCRRCLGTRTITTRSPSPASCRSTPAQDGLSFQPGGGCDCLHAQTQILPAAHVDQWHKHWQMTKEEEEDQTLLAKEGADRDENTASRAALFSVHMKAMGIGTWTGNVLQVFPTSY